MPITAVLVLVFGRGVPAGQPAGTPTPSAGSGASTGAVGLAPLPVDPPPASAAADRACPPMLAALPTRLRDRPLRPVRTSSAFVVAWGEPPVVLRCGVPRPAAFKVGSANLVQINDVNWFVQEQGQRDLWTAVDRSVYVELSVPADEHSAPAAVLSPVLARTLTERPMSPAN